MKLRKPKDNKNKQDIVKKQELSSAENEQVGIVLVTPDRWTDALTKFDAVLQGRRDFSEAYERIKPSKVKFQGIVTSRGLRSEGQLAADGRIVRPRTAELTPDLRKRLRGFRELDVIAFIPPSVIPAPSSSPLSNSRATSAGQVDLETAYKNPYLLPNHHRELLVRMLGCDVVDSYLKAKSTILMDSRAIETYTVPQDGNKIKKINLDLQLSPKTTPGDRFNLSRREIVDKYRLPAVQIPKRMTPTASRSSLFLLGPAEPVSELARSAEPSAIAEPQMGSILIDSYEPQISPIIKKYPPRREVVGGIFPLDYFIDHERTDQLFKLVDTNIIVKARCWPHPPGHYFETFDSLLASTNTHEYWNDCIITSVDKLNYRFTIEWCASQNDLGVARSKVSRKLSSEILMAGESLLTLRFILRNAQDIREQFEFNLGLKRSIDSVRALIPNTPSKSYNDMIGKIYINILESNAGLVNNCASMYPALYKEILKDVSDSLLKSILLGNITFIRFLHTPPLEVAPAIDESNTDFPASGSIKFRVRNVINTLDIVMTRNIVHFRDALSREFSELFSKTLLKLFSGQLSRQHPSVKEKEDKIQAAAEYRSSEQNRTMLSVLQTRNLLPRSLRQSGSPVKPMPATPEFSSRESTFELLEEPGQSQKNLAAPQLPLIYSRQSISTTGSVQKTPEIILPGIISSKPITPLIIKKTGQITFDFVDFVDACEWAMHDFSELFSVRIPETVYKLFELLLKANGIELENLEPSMLTLKELADKLVFRKSKIPQQYADSPYDLFEKLGKYATIFSESSLKNSAEKRIFELFELIRNAQLAINIDVIMKSENIQYNVDLIEMGPILDIAFAKWISPIKARLPSKVITSKHENGKVLLVLLKESFSDGVEKCTEFIKNMRAIIMPVLLIGSRLPIIDKDPKIYLEACEDCLQSFYRLKNISKSRFYNHSRGLFTIRCDIIATQVDLWISESKNKLIESILDTIRLKVCSR